MAKFMDFSFASALTDVVGCSGFIFNLTSWLGSYPYRFKADSILDFDTVSRAIILGMDALK